MVWVWAQADKGRTHASSAVRRRWDVLDDVYMVTFSFCWLLGGEPSACVTTKAFDQTLSMRRWRTAEGLGRTAELLAVDHVRRRLGGTESIPTSCSFWTFGRANPPGEPRLGGDASPCLPKSISYATLVLLLSSVVLTSKAVDEPRTRARPRPLPPTPTYGVGRSAASRARRSGQRSRLAGMGAVTPST